MSINITGTTMQAVINLRNGGFVGHNDLKNILRIFKDLQNDPYKSYALVSFYDHCKNHLDTLPDDLLEIALTIGLIKPNETSLSRDVRDVTLSCVTVKDGNAIISDPTEK